MYVPISRSDWDDGDQTSEHVDEDANTEANDEDDFEEYDFEECEL